MATELPGWCKWCGIGLDHHERAAGRAREFCSDRCRQRASRESRLREALGKEVGLNAAQAERLLDLFNVSLKRRT
ncbi:hypothetical protein N864_02850 [Intrasporangium chromatireducens Q5-1]|uniref:Uncharacterized protein n=1 Tax=Intrasporangium chromatireducens Q5-1 TaxID=584657 RepID=W9GHZ7_9MICO|nr:hypothetical protein [Intrasporangium chromatireducens]EWT05710.1 hypothetical protein N864_02850 [Intrasporangium chromatireducens Q5-1]